YLAVWAGLFLFHSAWGALVGFHIGILLSLMWSKPSLPLDILWKPIGWCSAVISILLGSSGGLGLYLLWDVFGIPADLNVTIFELGLVDEMQPWFIVYFSLVNPFMEEYF
ncbi:MAG: hypothetical protein HXY38_09620, partial [Chloroflexi bacterium]|nr:hypothetical protein [Chloroflexota bacterium]